MAAAVAGQHWLAAAEVSWNGCAAAVLVVALAHCRGDGKTVVVAAAAAVVEGDGVAGCADGDGRSATLAVGCSELAGYVTRAMPERYCLVPRCSSQHGQPSDDPRSHRAGAGAAVGWHSLKRKKLAGAGVAASGAAGAEFVVGGGWLADVVKSVDAGLSSVAAAGCGGCLAGCAL